MLMGIFLYITNYSVFTQTSFFQTMNIFVFSMSDHKQILFLKSSSSNHLLCQQNNFFLEIVLFRMTYLASTWTMGHSMAPSLKCLRCAPLQIEWDDSKNEINLYASDHHTGGVSTNQTSSRIAWWGPSLISFPYLCPSGDFSKFHIFLLRSDKHTSHLVKKKKCEKYGHQIWYLQSVGVTLLHVSMSFNDPLVTNLKQWYTLVWFVFIWNASLLCTPPDRIRC